MKHKVIKVLLIVVLLGTLTVLSRIETASASGTIYITETGEVVPPTDSINRAGDVYTFTSNIYETIVIQKDNIIVDGNGYTLQGAGIGVGFDLINIDNVTLRNTQVTQFYYGVSVSGSSNIIVNRNTIVGNVDAGVFLWLTNNTQVNGNDVSANGGPGISIGYKSLNNTIIYNTVSNNAHEGISLGWENSTDNRIIGNNITHNVWAGIYIVWSTVSDNEFYHNNLDNELQVTSGSIDALNVWDNGYPSGGNYWSDYAGIDSDGDGIGDTPYIIDANNRDNYPFMNPWSQQAHDITVANVEPSKTIAGQNYSLNIQVTVENEGVYTQTFNVATYANNTIIQTQTVTLADRSSAIMTFNWDTTNFPKSNYAISAIASVVPGETDTTDNTLTKGTVKVVIPGDVNADGTVGMADMSGISAHWYPGPPMGLLGYHPNFDINGDGSINMQEVSIMSAYWTGPPKGPLAP